MYRNRPYWAIAAEIAWQYVFYSSALWNPRELMWWLARQFGGDVRQMLVVVTCLILTLSWILPSICFVAIYKAGHPFFEQYKIQEWVWEKPDSVRKHQYYVLFRKTLEAFIFTQLLVCGAVYYFFNDMMKDQTEQQYTAYLNSTPQGLEAFPRFFLCLFIFETCFYWGHRFLHTRIGYPFHKDHHAYYTPISNAGNWGHIVDGILSLPFPAIFPVLFFDLHIYNIWQWAIMHIFHSQYDHCGYDFPWSPMQLIPFGHHADAHNFHHSHVVDNYGLYWRLWDNLMGTNKFWNKFCEDRERQIREAQRSGGAGAGDLEIKGGQVLVRTIGEARDVRDGTDNLSFTFKKHNMIKHMTEDDVAQLSTEAADGQAQAQARGQGEGQAAAAPSRRGSPALPASAAADTDKEKVDSGLSQQQQQQQQQRGSPRRRRPSTKVG